MQEIILDAAGWKGWDDFYASYLPAVGAPDWHGHNLNAIRDSLIVGDINALEPPFRVRIIGALNPSPECQEVLKAFAEIVAEARREGIPVELIRE